MYCDDDDYDDDKRLDSDKLYVYCTCIHHNQLHIGSRFRTKTVKEITGKDTHAQQHQLSHTRIRRFYFLFVYEMEWYLETGAVKKTTNRSQNTQLPVFFLWFFFSWLFYLKYGKKISFFSSFCSFFNAIKR